MEGDTGQERNKPEKMHVISDCGPLNLSGKR